MKITVSLCLLVLMTMLVSSMADMEPKCSKFDFEDKVIEKMVRMEYQNKLMMEDFMKICQQVKKELIQVKDYRQCGNRELVTMKTEFEYLRPPSYAFNAYWLADTSPSAEEALVFTRIQLNEGNFYDNSTGKYTAPLNGSYLFSTTLCLNKAKYAFMNFIADDTLIGAFKAGNSLGTTSHCSSSTVTASLQKDMEVWLKVKRISGTPFINEENEYRSNFAGHLIT